jgi:hypothetical protein
MLTCQEFAWFINTWHINGISQWHSRYMRQAHAISYEEFYSGFQHYLAALDWWQAERDLVMDAYRSWMTTGSINVAPVSGVNIHGWNLIHLTNLRMHANNTHGRFLNAAYAYIEQSYGHLFDDAHRRSAMHDLRKVSDAFVIRHDRLAHYPISVRTDSNIIDHIVEGHVLAQRSDPYVFQFPDDPTQNLSVFMQNIYYARRRNFGKARISRPEAA